MAERVDPVVLVTGSNGQVGTALLSRLTGFGRLVAAERNLLDLSDLAQVRRVVSQVKPAVIVNCAAYTAVDKAESDSELTMRINGEAPGVLAEEARRTGALLVHYSTDYVFDGSKDGAYVESDTPNPLNVYGASKLAGERAIAQAGGAWLVLRTSWVYGLYGKNFLLTMLRLGAQKKEIPVVADQFGAPTWAGTIADLTVQMLQQTPVAEKEALSWWTQRSGVYHMTAAGATSWAGFAEAIFAQAELDVTPTVMPIPTEAYPTPARRPRNSRLSNEKVAQAFNIQSPDWLVELQRCMSSHGQS
ncbi:dTDP-4-dehydrorhamnose reductase [Paraburkholderia humisilvae]|uniref:dTDP-4-dehydrorhamnose reductase n=1 Tax=Paraburkholderia humisilvae TaxID=627669 RepID=A0A6J5E371_9BURK|nr:dTDP-4-dehydrorhamnose reductase [Paraburkholderia humisilvae]CAB3760114.1 dTDP-4-dehydrorhamnose reductase [Paraburkholderia humisilvae]